MVPRTRRPDDETIDETYWQVVRQPELQSRFRPCLLLTDPELGQEGFTQCHRLSCCNALVNCLESQPCADNCAVVSFREQKAYPRSDADAPGEGEFACPRCIQNALTDFEFDVILFREKIDRLPWTQDAFDVVKSLLQRGSQIYEAIAKGRVCFLHDDTACEQPRWRVPDLEFDVLFRGVPFDEDTQHQYRYLREAFREIKFATDHTEYHAREKASASTAAIRRTQGYDADAEEDEDRDENCDDDFCADTNDEPMNEVEELAGQLRSTHVDQDDGADEISRLRLN